MKCSIKPECLHNYSNFLHNRKVLPEIKPKVTMLTFQNYQILFLWDLEKSDFRLTLFVSIWCHINNCSENDFNGAFKKFFKLFSNSSKIQYLNHYLSHKLLHKMFQFQNFLPSVSLHHLYTLHSITIQYSPNVQYVRKISNFSTEISRGTVEGAAIPA